MGLLRYWSLFVIALASAPFLQQGVLCSAECETGSCANFNTQGLPISKMFPEQTEELQLIAAGMRRKNLFVVEVDVYKVGIYTSPSIDSELMQKQLTAASMSSSLHTTKGEDGAALGIILRFVRSVGSDKIVSAMNDAFQPPPLDDENDQRRAYAKAVKDFNQLLTDLMAPNKGAKADDEIQFTFVGEVMDEVIVSMNGIRAGIVRDIELRNRLVDIYAGKQGITKEIRSILETRYLS